MVPFNNPGFGDDWNTREIKLSNIREGPPRLKPSPLLPHPVAFPESERPKYERLWAKQDARAKYGRTRLTGGKSSYLGL